MLRTGDYHRERPHRLPSGYPPVYLSSTPYRLPAREAGLAQCAQGPTLYGSAGWLPDWPGESPPTCGCITESAISTRS